MSMTGFQRAYADLAGSPSLCLDVRNDPVAALAPYDLDERERSRLARAVWHRGMNANCTVYRATRLTALNAVIPSTLNLIQPILRQLLDAYWKDHPVHDLGFARETNRFIIWLEAHAHAWPEVVPGIIAIARREFVANEAGLNGSMNAQI